MIKVFLVEDEAIIRRGIKKNVEWEKNGFEFVGEAGDGEYAYPQILKTEPDILITDIKMPFMDGLELSHLVKKILPNTKIIILSGYNEFEYAKEAITIGISEYLLKPVTAASLTAVLRKVKEEIREEKEKSRLLERYFVSYEKYNEFLDKTDYTGVDRKLIQDFLKLGSAGEEGIFLDEYLAAVGENNYRSLLLRQYMTIDIFFCVQEFLKGLSVCADEIPPELGDIKYIPKIVVSEEQTVSYLKELFAFAISERDRVSGNRYGSLIDTAKQYLAEHFESNDVSLNTVAAQVGVSSSYFSSIFKQETGQSFVEYLTKLRIDKACELLRCTTLRTAEIGERVGYNDPHYFSATFKKVTGVSPKDYKNGGQEPERRTV